MSALDDLKVYLGTTLGGDLPADSVLSGVLATELGDQFKRIKITLSFPGLGEAGGAWEAHPAALQEALLRRCARNLAMRKLPLGLAEGSDQILRVSGNDAEVRRLEAPYRRVSVG